MSSDSRPATLTSGRRKTADRRARIVRATPGPLTPGQRTMAELRAWKASIGDDWSPNEWEKIKRQNHFGKLDDREWAAVWSVVVAEIGPGIAHRESGFRRVVDDAALMSGFFDDHPGHPWIPDTERASSARKRREAKEKYLQQVKTFRDLSLSFWTDCSVTTVTNNRIRHELIPKLDYIMGELEDQIELDNEEIPHLKDDPPSASLLERDRWMGWLCIAWANITGRPAINRKPLRQFIVAATAPHCPSITDFTAQNFIKRWQCGEVPTPPALNSCAQSAVDSTG